MNTFIFFTEKLKSWKDVKAMCFLIVTNSSRPTLIKGEAGAFMALVSGSEQGGPSPQNKCPHLLSIRAPLLRTETPLASKGVWLGLTEPQDTVGLGLGRPAGISTTVTSACVCTAAFFLSHHRMVSPHGRKHCNAVVCFVPYSIRQQKVLLFSLPVTDRQSWVGLVQLVCLGKGYHVRWGPI